MKQHGKWRVVFVLTLSVAALCLAGAQERAVVDQVHGTALTAKVPPDPAITIGRFANGLRYYIRVNKQPANRIELRLAVNAGSILEDDDQQGLAHFVEHMAFNGTKNFPKDAVPKFFESIGMRFGPSLNAFTSFDQTVYMQTIPADKPDVVQKAFQVLEDWSHDLSFEPAEIDKERGVIVEEWRLGRGAGARIQDKQWPIMLKGSRYADRNPIGKKEIIETFKHDRLKKFYTDWYRPDLMAVVVVGDFDKAAIEGLVKTHFGALPKPAVPRLRPVYKVPEHPGTLYAIATDKEQPTTSAGVIKKYPERDRTTLGGYRQTFVERLYAAMFGRRMSEIAQKADPPFLGANGTIGATGIGKIDATQLNVSVKETGVERGLEAVLTESERVRKFGFTPTELDRQKRDMLRAYERRYLEREKRESASFADEYVRNFINDEIIPGNEYEYVVCQRFLPEITLDEINALAAKFEGPANRVVTLSAPEKPGLALPGEPKLAAAIARAAAGVADLKPWVDVVANATLMDSAPAPGRIASAAERAELGVTEWTLSNGVKVVLKPTTNKADEVLFRAFSPGGTSLAPDADFIPASTASMVVSAGGVGKFSAVELRNLLAGKVASASPSIGELEESLSGSASPKDLDTLFQLIYLRFTAPRADPTVFANMAAQRKAMLANAGATPSYAFGEALQTTLSQGHLRGRMASAETVDQWNLDKSLAFYKDRFADAGDFTFIFVGTFTPDVMKPLVEKYLASLPSTGRKETWKDVGMAPPKGVVEKTVKKGIEPQSQTAIVFTGPFQYDQARRIAIRSLVSTLDTKLRETLREDLSGTYGVSVSPTYGKFPVPRYTLAIQFGCNPQRADELAKAIFREIEVLQTNGPTEKQVNEVLQGFLRDMETSFKDNTYLLSQMTGKYQNGEDLGELFTLPELYKKQVTVALIQEAAKTYLNKANYVRVTLLPETPAPQAGMLETVSAWLRLATPARQPAR
jgi:zinc protease